MPQLPGLAHPQYLAVKIHKIGCAIHTCIDHTLINLFPEPTGERPEKKGLSQAVKVAIFIGIFVVLYIALDRF